MYGAICSFLALELVGIFRAQLRRQRLHLGRRLTQCHAVLQSPYHRVPTRGGCLRHLPHWIVDPHLVVDGKFESLGHDSNDRIDQTIERHALAQHRRLSAEEALPQVVADDGHLRRPVDVVVGHQRSSQDRVRARGNAEQLRIDGRTLHPLADLIRLQRRQAIFIARERLEAGLVRVVVEEVEVIDATGRMAPAVLEPGDGHDLFGFVHGERLVLDRVDLLEQKQRHAEAQGERQDDDERILVVPRQDHD